MLIDLIVGSAVLLFGLFGGLWVASPALRERIERPKHVFLEQAQACDRHAFHRGQDPASGASTHE